MFRCRVVCPLFILLVMGCATAPTDKELCEASENCEVIADGEYECVGDAKWEDMADPKNFNCISCDEDEQWINSDQTDHTCKPICKYPEGFGRTTGLVLNELAPPYAWEDALFGDGSEEKFSFEDFYCDEDTDKKAIIIIVSTGWCGSCPAYMAAFAEKAGLLDAMGAQILYWIMETNDHGEVADNAFAHTYVDNYCGADDYSYRVGGTTTKWIYDGGRAVDEKAGSGYHVYVPYVPFGYVIKRDNMKVVDDGTTSYPQYQDFVDVMNRLLAGEFDE